MGLKQNPKLPAAQCTARFQALLFSTVVLEGATRMPAALLVFVCAFYATKILPLGRWPRPYNGLIVRLGFSIAVPEAAPRFLSPGFSGGGTSSKTSATTFWGVVLANVLPRRRRAIPQYVYILVLGCLDG